MKKVISVIRGILITISLIVLIASIVGDILLIVAAIMDFDSLLREPTDLLLTVCMFIVMLIPTIMHLIFRRLKRHNKLNQLKTTALVFFVLSLIGAVIGCFGGGVIALICIPLPFYFLPYVCFSGGKINVPEPY